MKVYVVTTGSYSYSDYGVAKIFLDKNKAEEFSNWIQNSNGVDELDLADNDFEIGGLNGKAIVDAIYLLNSDRFLIHATKTYENSMIFDKFNYVDGFGLSITKIMPEDFDENEIKKILYDKYTEVESLLVEGYTVVQINEMINR